MNIATKTLATILLVTMLTFNSINVSAASSEASRRQREDKQLERLYKRHDRKMELRASVLGISADQLREKLKNQSFDQIIKQSGFKDRVAFHTALIGKMREELKARGWDDSRIKKFVEKRLSRYTKNTES